jgi:peroxiredoxin
VLGCLIRRLSLVVLLAFAGVIGSAEDANARRVRGIVGQKAPALDVNTWFNLAPGKKSVRLKDMRGKVMMLFFFQSWCPGCHSRGFPTLQMMQRHYAKASDVGFLVVQTVFEGFGTNTARRAKRETDKLALTIPVGHDAGVNKSGSRVMKRYRSGGTPWIVIIDKKGVVRYNAFHIRPKQAITLMDSLR